jgi:hypothetical protein
MKTRASDGHSVQENRLIHQIRNCNQNINKKNKLPSLISQQKYNPAD